MRAELEVCGLCASWIQSEAVWGYCRNLEALDKIITREDTLIGVSVLRMGTGTCSMFTPRGPLPQTIPEHMSWGVLLLPGEIRIRTK